MKHLFSFTTLIVCALAGSAHAVVVKAFDVEDLTARASDVVAAKVLEVEAHWDDSKKRIYTDVEVEVTRCYKGPCDSTLMTVQVLGGAVGDYTMAVSGVARYVPGEEVLLFLEPLGAQTEFRTTGLAQGKFKILPSTEGLLAVRDHEGLQLFGARRAAAEALHKVRLDDLVLRIDAALDAVAR